MSSARRTLLLSVCVVTAAMLLWTYQQQPQRALGNVLMMLVILLGVVLGACFFIALQYLMKGAWAVVLRRIPEALTGLLPAAAALTVIVWLGHAQLYHWVHPHGDVLLEGKQVFLNMPFFTLRLLIYFSLWFLIIGRIVKHSRAQDEDGSPTHTFANVRWSAAYMIVFALSYSFASFDLVMSLEPHWFSTIFGVYNFAGAFLSALTVTTLLVIYYRRKDCFKDIQPVHVTFLAKLIFAFCIFWAYIWFSQFMLIWYSNIPEETVYFIPRMQGAWRPLFFANLALNWLVPFLGLLGYRAKRNIPWLVCVCMAVLAGRALDVYLMVMPPLSHGHGPQFGAVELLSLASIAALGLLFFKRTLHKHPLAPTHDPLFQESAQLHE